MEYVYIFNVCFLSFGVVLSFSVCVGCGRFSVCMCMCVIDL